LGKNLKLLTLGHYLAGRFDQGLSPELSLGAAKQALQAADLFRGSERLGF
jgi:hypothetical protein